MGRLDCRLGQTNLGGVGQSMAGKAEEDRVE